MKTIKIYGSTVDDKTLHSVVDILKDGGIVIYPTDTLYAIGCDALNNNAINKICKLKGINPDKQFLSIVCDSISMAAEYAKFDNAGFKLLKRNVLAHLRLFSRLCLRCRRHLREEKLLA